MSSHLYPELNDAAWLRDQYLEQRRSTFHIAEIVGCDQTLVYRALRRHGVPTRSKAQSMQMLPARRRMSLSAQARKAKEA